MANLEPELVRHALSVARQYGFVEVELGIGEESFSARLDPAPKKSQAVKSAGSTVAPEPEFQTITSTLVGYYRTAKPALQVGTNVKKGDVVAIVAALGIANDVESKFSGEIVEVLVEPNQPVEYGQALAKVKV
jgi:acetyl-CoA carboxylase biotin carboxyl carrier protein